MAPRPPTCICTFINVEHSPRFQKARRVCHPIADMGLQEGQQTRECLQVRGAASVVRSLLTEIIEVPSGPDQTAEANLTLSQLPSLDPDDQWDTPTYCAAVPGNKWARLLPSPAYMAFTALSVHGTFSTPYASCLPASRLLAPMPSSPPARLLSPSLTFSHLLAPMPSSPPARASSQNNPTNPSDLTTSQLARSIMFTFQNTSSFDARLSLHACATLI